MAEKALVKADRSSELTTPERTRNRVLFTPRVDILENADELIVLADLPGVNPEDVDVRYENGDLVLQAPCPPRQEGAQFLLSEYGVGDYYRAFTLNETIDADKIHAEYKNGVLTVHLPKSEARKPKRINVQSA